MKWPKAVSPYDVVIIPSINKNEVNDYKWITLDKLQKEINTAPENYTIWFRIILEKYKLSLKKWISQ